MTAALGFIKLVERAERAGEIVPGPRVIGLERDGVVERLDRFLELAELELERAEIAPDLGLLRVDLQ